MRSQNGPQHPVTHLVSHFEDAEQQRATAQLGMWVFLASEVLFFGGVCSAYVIYRITYPMAFETAARHTQVVIGGLNTAVLLSSSLAMALAVHSAKEGKKKPLFWFLALTASLGIVFLGLKLVEYAIDYQEHLVPYFNYSLPMPQAAQGELFFVLYFVITLLHAIHMIIGIGVISTMMIRTHRNHFTARYHTPIEIAGLYWHFVDIVWVFLFPMLYLVNRT